jgi:glycosyltransferase involved in cell wall biosynthesis
LKVSIVLPVFGASPFVVETIASLLVNMEPDEELIIVFDRTEPNTAKRILEMIPTNFRARIISSLKPGLVAALNVGVTASTSELVARMDADDVILKGRLAAQARQFEKDSGLVALGTQAIHIDENGSLLGRSRLPIYSWQIAAELSLWNPLSHPTMMYRRKAILDVGGYDESALAAEDFELARRLRSVGKIRNLPIAGILYRIHPNQVTRTKTSQAAETISRIIASVGPSNLSIAKAQKIVSLYLAPKHWWSSVVSLFLFSKHKPLDAVLIVVSKIVTLATLSLMSLKYIRKFR